MKKIFHSKIIKNEEISNKIFDIKISIDNIEVLENIVPGQFLELYPDNNKNILSRPISICEVNKAEKWVRLIFQAIGEGSDYFSKLKINDDIRVLGVCGNGFKIVEDCENKEVLVVGGGIGIPPMFELCKEILLKGSNVKINVVLGFRSGSFMVSDFENLGKNVEVHVATDDGSVGFKGNVVQLIKETNFENIEMIYSCGPKVMLKFLSQYAMERKFKIQVSMEERMACGIGACVGCVVKIKDDLPQNNGWVYKKVCVDGPVFNGNEVVWDE